MRIALLCAAVLMCTSPDANAQDPGPARPAQPHILFFEVDMVDLTPALRAELDRAIAGYERSEPVELMIAGRADRAGAASYCCVGLSQRRNGAVRDYLQSRGVANSDIQTEAFALEPTTRRARVRISFGPGSGW